MTPEFRERYKADLLQSVERSRVILDDLNGQKETPKILRRKFAEACDMAFSLHRLLKLEGVETKAFNA